MHVLWAIIENDNLNMNYLTERLTKKLRFHVKTKSAEWQLAWGPIPAPRAPSMATFWRRAGSSDGGKNSPSSHATCNTLSLRILPLPHLPCRSILGCPPAVSVPSEAARARGAVLARNIGPSHKIPIHPLRGNIQWIDMEVAARGNLERSRYTMLRTVTGTIQAKFPSHPSLHPSPEVSGCPQS
jgi:hypothetical protein